MHWAEETNMYQDHIQEDKEIAQNHKQVIISLPVHYCSRRLVVQGRTVL